MAPGRSVVTGVIGPLVGSGGLPLLDGVGPQLCLGGDDMDVQ